MSTCGRHNHERKRDKWNSSTRSIWIPQSITSEATCGRKESEERTHQTLALSQLLVLSQKKGLELAKNPREQLRKTIKHTKENRFQFGKERDHKNKPYIAAEYKHRLTGDKTLYNQVSTLAKRAISAWNRSNYKSHVKARDAKTLRVQDTLTHLKVWLQEFWTALVEQR